MKARFDFEPGIPKKETKVNEAVSVREGAELLPTSSAYSKNLSFLSYLLFAFEKLLGSIGRTTVRFANALIRATPRVLTARAYPVPVKSEGASGPLVQKG